MFVQLYYKYWWLRFHYRLYQIIPEIRHSLAEEFSIYLSFKWLKLYLVLCSLFLDSPTNEKILISSSILVLCVQIRWLLILPNFIKYWPELLGLSWRDCFLIAAISLVNILQCYIIFLVMGLHSVFQVRPHQYAVLLPNAITKSSY